MTFLLKLTQNFTRDWFPSDLSRDCNARTLNRRNKPEYAVGSGREPICYSSQFLELIILILHSPFHPQLPLLKWKGNLVIITLIPNSFRSSCHFNVLSHILSHMVGLCLLRRMTSNFRASKVHQPNKAICKYVVCFEQTFCSGSIWLTRIIKHLNKNHCLLPLESVQRVRDSLEGWQETRYIVLGAIQTNTEGPVCHLPPTPTPSAWVPVQSF